jgi:hypothetical protein
MANWILRDLVNATVGVETLAAKTGGSAKSFYRMVSEKRQSDASTTSRRSSACSAGSWASSSTLAAWKRPSDREVFNRDPEPTINRLAELLPWNWKGARADSEWEQRAV